MPALKPHLAELGYLMAAIGLVSPVSPVDITEARSQAPTPAAVLGTNHNHHNGTRRARSLQENKKWLGN